MTNNVRKFFQGLTLTSFGLGIFNTVKNSNNKELLRNFILEQEKNSKLIEEIDKLKTECNEQKFNTLENDNEVLRKSLDLVTSKSEIENDLNNLNILNQEIKENNDYSSEDFQDKFNNLVEKLNKDISENTDKTEQLIETIKKVLDSDSNNLINTNQIFDSIQNLYNNISIIDSLAIIHISGSIFILISLYSIILILFGDKLILYFKLEDKYPRLAKFLKFRRKLQNYTITFNFILIILVLLITIFFNLYILFIKYY